MPNKSSHEGLPDNINNGNSINNLQSPELAPFWLLAIIDSADDAIITKTLEGIITSWNKSAERIFGYKAEEIVGKPVQILIPDDHPDEEPTILARLRAGDRIEHYETVRVRKDGSLVDISLTVSPIKTPDGKIIGASKIVRDITERKWAEEKLLQAAAIVENSDDAIISKDLEGRILSWNPGAERIYGYTAAEAVGQSITMLIPADRPDEEPHILEQIRRGERVDHYETVRRRKDGSLMDVSLTVSPVKDTQGRIVGASKIARDITERKRVEAERNEQAEIIEMVNRVGQAVAGELDMHKLVQAVTDAATEITNAHFGSFFYNVLNEAGAVLYCFTLFPVCRAKPLPIFRCRAPQIFSAPPSVGKARFSSTM